MHKGRSNRKTPLIVWLKPEAGLNRRKYSISGIMLPIIIIVKTSLFIHFRNGRIAAICAGVKGNGIEITSQ